MKWLIVILTALFTAAKLSGVIQWSWWLVFTPLIVYLAFYLLLFIGIGLVAIISTYLDDK